MNASERVAALRQLLDEHALDAYIIPSEDAHMSEYVASCDDRRSYISGFTGSAGTVLISKDAALLWTDGRYFVQAENQLDSSVFTLMRIQEDDPLEEWSVKHLRDEAVIGIDACTVSMAGVKRMRNAFTSAAADGEGKKILLKTMAPPTKNLVDILWGDSRPKEPAAPVRVHDVKYAGMDVTQKIEGCRKAMREITPKPANTLVVTGLDEVAWLLNMRGSDVDYNPVFWSYVVVTMQGCTLYTDGARFQPGVNEHLAEHGVSVRPYSAIFGDLSSLLRGQNGHMDTSSSEGGGEVVNGSGTEQSGTANRGNDGVRTEAEGNSSEKVVWLDQVACNQALLDVAREALGGESNVVMRQSPVIMAKAVKNRVELAGMRASHARDAVALCRFFTWLERVVVEEGRDVDECDAAAELDGYRSELDLYISLSFPTISSFGANGAIIHYKPEKATCARVQRGGIYLVDSGGQYYDGTTDVTRTTFIGGPDDAPTDWQRQTYTRVLQGHIALDSAVFPVGTTGHLLDGFARRPLWSAGLDYKHGTGHGVGSCLNVHEGPHMISFRPQALETGMRAGFITSNEPGYYEEGNFGIRIESLCIMNEAFGNESDEEKEQKKRNGGKPFLKLEHMTLVPIDTKLIDVELLSKQEVQWIDEYHQEVYEKISGKLNEYPDALAWLQRRTRPLQAQGE